MGLGGTVMWGTIPPYHDQPVIELTPATSDAVLYGYQGSVGYSATTSTPLQTFHFKDFSIGAVHLVASFQAFFDGLATSQERLLIRLGDRYSFVIRAMRHNVNDSGSVGDAIILGPLVRMPNSFAPANVFYFEAALQDSNSDVVVRRIYPSQAEMFVAVGYFYDDAHQMHAYANVSAALYDGSSPQRRSDYGLRTYCMRMSVNAYDAMDGDRSIQIRNTGFLRQGFTAAAAHYGPLGGWLPLRPTAQSDRRARSNTCVGALRSPAVNFAYPARQNYGNNTNEPTFSSDIATIDCAGESFFDSRRYASTDGSLNRFYVAALGEHPDGSKAFAKPVVQWNSNLTEIHETNERLSKLRIDAEAGFLVSVFPNRPRPSLPIENLLANTNENGNNEYIGSQNIAWQLDPDGFPSFNNFVRLNVFAGISAFESLANHAVADFTAVELLTTFRLELTIFLIRDDGAIFIITNINTALTEGEFAQLASGSSIDVRDDFNDKVVTLTAVGP
jgi:hypothetical protein